MQTMRRGTAAVYGRAHDSIASIYAVMKNGERVDWPIWDDPGNVHAYSAVIADCQSLADIVGVARHAPGSPNSRQVSLELVVVMAWPACQTMVMSLLAGAEVQALLADAAGRARRYLAGLDERPVAPDGAALAALAGFDEPLPEVAGDPAATLALLDEAGSAATVASAGGRYFGFVIGGSYPVTVAAGWLATAWDQNVALPVMSPVAARLHEVVTGWLAELLGLPRRERGGICDWGGHGQYHRPGGCA